MSRVAITARISFELLETEGIVKIYIDNNTFISLETPRNFSLQRLASRDPNEIATHVHRLESLSNQIEAGYEHDASHFDDPDSELLDELARLEDEYDRILDNLILYMTF